MIAEEGTGTEPKSAWDPALLSLIRKAVPRLIAEELVSVQPMDPEAYNELREKAFPGTEEELRAEGFEPVSHLGLLWVKKE